MISTYGIRIVVPIAAIFIGIVVFVFWALAQGRGEAQQLPFVSVFVSDVETTGTVDDLVIHLDEVHHIVGDRARYDRRYRQLVNPAVVVVGTMENTADSPLRVACPSFLTLAGDGGNSTTTRIDFENSDCFPGDREAMIQSIRGAVRAIPEPLADIPPGCQKDTTGFCIEPGKPVRFAVQMQDIEWLAEILSDDEIPAMEFSINLPDQRTLKVDFSAGTAIEREEQDYYPVAFPSQRPVQGDIGPTGRRYYDTPLSN